MLTEFTTLGFAVESTYGTFPTANKTLINVQDARPTKNRSEQAPNVWTGDRRTHAMEMLEQSGAITIPTPLQYENGLLFQEALMASTRSAAISETGTDVSAASNVITSTAEADMSAFSVHDMVHLSGAGISPNVAGWYGPVTAKTATTLTLAGPTITDFSAGSTVLIRTRRLVDGITESSLAFEMQLTKGTNQFIKGEGYKPSQIAWSWQQGQFATEEITLQGQEWTWESATAASGSVAAKTTGFMNAIEAAKGGVQRIWIADGTSALGAATTLVVSNWTITWQQLLQSVLGIGNSGPSAIDQGGLDGSNMTANVRFDDTARTAVSDLIEAYTLMQMAIACQDKQGNSLCFFQPCGTPMGDVEMGNRGTTVFQPLTVNSADPAKTSDSVYYNAGAGTGYQHAIFFAPAV